MTTLIKKKSPPLLLYTNFETNNTPTHTHMEVKSAN